MDINKFGNKNLFTKLSPGKVKKSVSFKKDPKYYDPSTKMLRFLIGGNPKSNKACPKLATGKKCAGPCAFLHQSVWWREG